MDERLPSHIFVGLFAIAFGFILSESVVRESQDDLDWRHPGDLRDGTRVLYRMSSVADDAPDPREQDREWCHVNDFWAADVQELYVRSFDAASPEGKDPAVRIIELSIAAFDEEFGTPD